MVDIKTNKKCAMENAILSQLEQEIIDIYLIYLHVSKDEEEVKTGKTTKYNKNPVITFI